MERIVDKLIVLACCAPALTLMGTGPVVVGSLLAAVTCAFAAQAMPVRLRQAPAVLWCALALAVPGAAAFGAPAAYDLAGRTPALALIAIAPLVLAVQMGNVSPAVFACSLIACAVAAVLARRTEVQLAERSRNLLRADTLRERELALERQNRELEDAQDYEVRLATLTERARIAREIHDNVGHLLTRATMQAEALRVVHAASPAEAGIAQLADTLHEALDEVRTSVHDLRDDACDLSVQIRGVIERACAGTDIEAYVHAEAGEAPAPVASCLVAVAREAVSNTLRHAHATRLTVELIEHPGLWRLTITDDGIGASATHVASGQAAAPDTGAGMGLASMEERVRALDGTFRAGPGAAGGWTVFVSIPKSSLQARRQP